jgi:hypothetical protein
MPGARILAASRWCVPGPAPLNPQAAPGRPRDPVPLWREAVMRVPIGAAEREEFPAGVHAGVLSVAVGTAGRRLAVPAWYRYQPGGLLTVLIGRRPRTAAAKDQPQAPGQGS